VTPGEGARRCECLRNRLRQRALDRIPTIYRRFTLENALADPARHPSQALVLAAMRKQPETSFAFFGANGCGKSLFGWLLYRKAIESNRYAVGMPLADLLQQFRAWEKDPDKLPAITPGDLQQSNRRYLIFLDEVEKARPSEFSAEMLFRLVDAAYSYDHQLVIASNHRPEQLSAHWAANGETYGPSIVRRILEMENGIEVPMF
jgi:DNA replication protein DnaC